MEITLDRQRVHQTCPSCASEFVVVRSESPWKSETYLGAMLDRNAVLGGPLKDLVFHAASHIVHELPEVREYLR